MTKQAQPALPTRQITREQLRAAPSGMDLMVASWREKRING